jgi:hypothetical protein
LRGPCTAGLAKAWSEMVAGASALPLQTRYGGQIVSRGVNWRILVHWGRPCGQIPVGEANVRLGQGDLILWDINIVRCQPECSRDWPIGG